MEQCSASGEDTSSVSSIREQRPRRFGFDRQLVEEAVDLPEIRAIDQVLAILSPPPVDVAEDRAAMRSTLAKPTGSELRPVDIGGTVEDMEPRRVPASEWRQMSDEEQRAVIRAGFTEVEDLPEDFRREVEDMLAQHRLLPRSA